MRWDRLFEDLENQLASEWEAERAALDSEAERLRLSKALLRERLGALTWAGVPGADRIGLELSGGRMLRGQIAAVGADFVALDREDAVGSSIVRLAAVTAIVLSAEAVLRSARPSGTARSALSERLGFGFVLRDAARRRLGTRIVTTMDRVLVGTIDRVGADHLDIALHDADAPRRAAGVTGYRIVAFTSISCVDLARGSGAALL